MISRRAALATLAGAASLMAGCDGAHWDGGVFFQPYRYALTVEVETPEGVTTGSSVIENKWGFRSFKVRGEAVAVDLPDGQTLFVLLRSQSDVDWASKGSDWIDEDTRKSWAVPKSQEGVSSDERAKVFWGNVAAYRGSVPIPRKVNTPGGEHDNYPLFVRFRDIRDSKSVVQVDPDDLAKSFGPGVKLKSLTARFTDEPVTTGIEKRLEWLSSVGRQRATLIERPQRKPEDGLPLLRDATPIQLVSPNDFSTELYK